MRSVVSAFAVAMLGASLAVGLSSPAQASGGGSTAMPTPTLVDPDFATARKMIDATDYGRAFPLLQKVVARDPNNADAYTLMGYAVRKSGEPAYSLQFYNQALSIDPKHIGAHEYLGEAYLMLDRLPEAEQHLVRLNQICLFGCTEVSMLKTAIANYKAGKKPH